MKTKFSGLLTLLLALVVQISFAQTKTVTGTVTDGSGVPLPGVNILVQNSTTGTQTDFDGNYSIEVATGETLVFSYVGFQEEQRVVGASSTINVSLQAGEALEEVVVTALGISREKKSLGYATQEVSSEELTETRNTNALNALSGKVAGVQISNATGNLGGSSRIVIRGIGSITQENRPLIVVDGIPLDNSNYNSSTTQAGGGGRDFGDTGFDINPDDIASMNVLKGGAAAALYGSRASNGVIQITTKSGKKGKGEVVVNSGITFEEVNILPKVQKLYGGGGGNFTIGDQGGFNQATINGTTFDVVDFATDESWGPRYEGQQVLHWDAFDPEFEDDYLQTRPWLYPENDGSTLFQTGYSYNNGVAFSQGGEDSNMRMSINNTQTEGILPNTKLNKTSVNFNGSTKIGDKLKVDASVNFTVTDGFNRPAVGYTGESVILQLYQFGQTSLDYNRLQAFQTPDGRQRTWNRISATNPLPRYTDNPYWVLNKNTAEDKRTRWYGTVGATYNFTDELYAVAKVYGDTYDFRVNQRTAVGSQALPGYSESDRDFQEINYETRVHFDKNVFDNKLSINAFVGGNRRVNEFHALASSTNGGLVVPNFYNLSNSAENPSVSETDTQRQINSLFGSVSLGYDNFAYLTVTGRNDWSSTLPADNNSYFYPSFSGSFIASQFINADWLSFLKLRAGYAEVGSDTDPYQLRNVFIGDDPFLGSVPFSLNNSNKNSELRPEDKRTYEFGVEASFFNRRLGFDITYYNELTKDLITPVQVDPSTGFTSTVLNAGELENKGIELLVNATPLMTDDFSWDVTFNFAKNENTLLSLAAGLETLQIARFPFNGVSLNAVVGERYGQIRGTNFVYDDQGNKVVNDNGSYAETQDVQNLGSILPDYNLGIRNSFTYKGISLGFLIDHQKGGKFRSLTNIWGNYSGILEQTAANNIREEGLILPGVTGDVTYNDDGSYTVTNTAENTQVISAQQFGTDYFFGNDNQNVFDATYWKLREVTLGYSLPKKWLGNALSDVRVTAFGRNLLVWGLDNANFDPEVATSGSGNIQGSEGGSLPSTRSYGLNVQLKF
ncbi:MAG: SusC/RagA family TonB-linked outer membrane protein [Leeuwenhoekiella sp.]|uniref:SusC/RagA family TonB-linked outer membrane protein n=1 Tax=Leeuwenhoekiella nanhaiensis TaxID=1655491 RepID=A0A2G1VRU4_9FLAO|nr:SusC/RagA family TonB-linked outer membrane protein [Leeuwenhoekiella nanhaiensis]PHQ29464.1 SusC/RagA family TonB-linked outer membrane protein [Leeuwenhoekiella nanhaiensis]PHR92771.1 MAG: SusC/RagA family TonB-linked outer membrane protein [Leeuwenhoekiella sp.]